MAYKFQLGSAIVSGSLRRDGGDASVRSHSGVEKYKVTAESGIVSASAVYQGGSVDVDGPIDGAGGFKVNNTAVVSPARQLQNIASLDATTETTIETAIDTLANLASAGTAGAELEFAGSIDAAQGLKVANTVRIDTAGEGSFVGVVAGGAISAATTIAASGLASLDGGINVNDDFTVDTDGAVVAVGVNVGGALSGATSLDGTTEATIEAAIDTLANLASAGTNGNELEFLGSIDSAQGIKIANVNFADASRNLLAGNVSGSGTLQFGGTVRLDGAADAALAVAADSLYFFDADNNLMKRDSIVDFTVGIAGAGLSAANGQMALDLNELTAEQIASGDFLPFIDNTDNGTHKETIDDIAVLLGGTGIAASNAVLSVDFNQLPTLAKADIEMDEDFFAIMQLDGTASQKTAVADLIERAAGGGLTANGGVLSVQGNTVAARADGETLTEGYNVFADLTSDATVTMPASPSVGDVLTVKAKGLTAGTEIIVNKAGSQLIDGQTSILIESPYAAVTMVYVAANDWRIV